MYPVAVISILNTTFVFPEIIISHPNYSFPSQRPSFEHAGLTCYTLLSPSITFSLFYSELKTYLFRKSYPPPYSLFLSIGMISWLWTVYWIHLPIGCRFGSISSVLVIPIRAAERAD